MFEFLFVLCMLVIFALLVALWHEWQRCKHQEKEIKRLAEVLRMRSNQLRQKGVEAKQFELELKRIRRRKI